MARRTRIERNVTFACLAPEAQQVAVAGCFTNWEQAPINLKKGKGGLWETSVALPPGTYQYRLLVDGQWCDDPQCPARVTNPFGTENCVRTVA